jgi:formylglycine-generating enzyme required for sulfatase activity
VEAERRRLQQKQPLASEGRGPLPITQPAQPAQSTQSAQPAQLIQPVQGLSPINSTIPSPQTIDLGRGVGLTLVKIPGGQFWMGSAPEDIQGANYEYPQHQVQVPAFWLGETPVTQAQWLAVMGQFKRDPGFKGADRPIENISWQDAMEFCQHLSQRMGQILRLPTEAEWEYACRAGSQTRYCFGDDTTLLGDYAWYNANSGSKTHGVKQKKPNLWGLYDMHGNVWEWCADQWHKTYQQKPETSLQNGSIPWSCPRQSPNHNTVNHNTVTIQVLRGGAWYNAPRSCRSVIRGRGKCKSFYNLRGFRLALSFGALSIGAL